MNLRKLVTAGIALVVVLAGTGFGLYLFGIIGVPSVTVADPGDWGEVTEEETEIITTVEVKNPNPIGINLASFDADYDISMNDVTVATGNKSGLNLDPGNNTLKLRTNLQNDKLQPWWVTYVRNNETIDMTASGTAKVGTPMGKFSHDFTQNQTMLSNSTPMISALSEAASSVEGTYTKEIDAGVTSASAGYEIRDGSAKWGEVTENTTTVLFTFEIHNPGDVPVPAVPEGVQVDLEMNDVEMFTGGEEAMTVRNTASDALIQPGDTQTVVLAIDMDNDKIDDWFTSHVRNDEHTQVDASFRLTFEHEGSGTTFSIPQGDAATYQCNLQTGLLVDDQVTKTDCGETA